MKRYIREKVKAYKDFGIRFNEEQIAYMHSLKNEIQVDNYTYDFLFPKTEVSKTPMVWCGNI